MPLYFPLFRLFIVTVIKVPIQAKSMNATILYIIAPHFCPQPDINLGVQNSLNDRPVVMATLMSCHSYFTAGVLAVDYTEILRSLHEGGLVSDRVKREIESSAAITGWS